MFEFARLSDLFSYMHAGSICKRDILAEMETGDMIVDVDENSMDPQLCATMASDIYKHLRESEVHCYPI